MNVEKTKRGFQVIRFTDRYNVPCSLQISSIATEPCVWFGCDDANLQELTDDGWKPVEGDFFATTRMHLSKDMVEELITYLTTFTQTGSLTLEGVPNENI